jgi:hypothetical protein
MSTYYIYIQKVQNFQKKRKTNLCFCRAYTQLDELCALFKSTIVDPVLKPQSSSQQQPSTSQQRSREQRSRLEDDDPLRVPTRRPPQRAPGGWCVFPFKDIVL